MTMSSLSSRASAGGLPAAAARGGGDGGVAADGETAVGNWEGVADWRRLAQAARSAAHGGAEEEEEEEGALGVEAAAAAPCGSLPPSSSVLAHPSFSMVLLSRFQRSLGAIRRDERRESSSSSTGS